MSKDDIRDSHQKYNRLIKKNARISASVFYSFEIPRLRTSCSARDDTASA